MSARKPVIRSRARVVLGAVLVVLALAACGGSVQSAPAGSAAVGSSPVVAGSSPVAGGEAPAALPAEVDVATAASLQQQGAFVLDVREPSEWTAGHIQGATLIPLGELSGRVAEVPADRQVVVVCRSGNRSAQGRDILLGAGLPAVTSMAGGMSAWTAAGQPVVTGQ